MAVRKERNTWWIDFRFNRQRYRKRSPENSKAGAQAYEALMRQKMARGESLDPTPKAGVPKEKPFNEFAPEWLEAYARVNNKPSTIKSKESILKNHLLPHFGTLALSEIKDLRIEKFKAAQLARTLSAKSIDCHLSVLLGCLKSAREWGYLESMPRIVWLKLPPLHEDHYSSQEVTQLLSVKNSMVKEMVLCALRTGMRIGEICALDWLDIDLNNKTFLVRHTLVNGIMGSPKNNKTRLIPIANDLYLGLSLRGKRTGFVFAREDGKPFTKSAPWKELKKLCQEAGVRYAGWHIFRHTFASFLSKYRAPTSAIQKLLGHSTLQMTERYTHTDQETLSAAIMLFEAPLAVLTNSFGQQVPNTSEKEI